MFGKRRQTVGIDPWSEARLSRLIPHDVLNRPYGSVRDDPAGTGYTLPRSPYPGSVGGSSARCRLTVKVDGKHFAIREDLSPEGGSAQSIRCRLFHTVDDKETDWPLFG
jgi:hypothetical protein